MLKIYRKEDEVKVDLITNIEGAETWTYYLGWTSNSRDYAQLLVNQLNATLKAHLKKIRKDAYDQGFLDAKAKRKKETWFSGWF